MSTHTGGEVRPDMFSPSLEKQMMEESHVINENDRVSGKVQRIRENVRIAADKNKQIQDQRMIPHWLPTRTPAFS